MKQLRRHKARLAAFGVLLVAALALGTAAQAKREAIRDVTAVADESSALCNLSEGFDDITTLFQPNGDWFQQNSSKPLGATNWFQGDPTWFTAQAGAADAYIAANYANAGGGLLSRAGGGPVSVEQRFATISNWLLTPPVTLRNGSVLTFWTRTVSSPVWPDRLQVRMSNNGASRNVGSTATSVGDFKRLLLDINPTYTTSGYPSDWTQFTVTLSGITGRITGRLALRYFVEDGGAAGSNSQYIGIDTVSFDC